MDLMRRVWGFLRGRPFQPESQQQREFTRVLVRFAIAFSGEHKKGKGIARDLSLGGCLIETDTPQPVDTLLELKLFVAETDMPVEAAASRALSDSAPADLRLCRSGQRSRHGQAARAAVEERPDHAGAL